ncbi:DUF3156 family protein [Brenneria uluponensis]|uniref:DUF3156 family protein n=1 Tax=Brenneria uluponensis TaxID=3057057 RepID=UPI0028EF0316|nr:DUF3156 family protein [Brenneria ulupoensis]
MNFAPFREYWAGICGADRLPAGYLAGATLRRLQDNLAPHQMEPSPPANLQLTLPDGGFVHIREQVQRLFMAHIVSCPFSSSGTIPLDGAFMLTVMHTGMVRRNAVRFQTKSAAAEAHMLATSLQEDKRLMDLLLGLDFRRCEISVAERRWTLSIEHFAASEVIGRLPAGRRYLKLTPAQRKKLLMAIMLFRRHLSTFQPQK